MLVGQFNSIYQKNGVDKSIFKKGYTEEQLRALEARIGKSTKTIESCGIRFTCDIADLKLDEFDFIYTMFDKYNANGVLPFPGSHSEQPAKIIEYFHIMSNLSAEREEFLANQNKVKK